MRGSITIMLMLFVTGCASPLAARPEGVDPQPGAVGLVDPLAQGPRTVESGDYDAGAVEVGGPDANHSDYSYDARIRGRAWWPSEAGRYPTLLLLHGQHGTCAIMGIDTPVLGEPEVDDCDDAEGVNAAWPNHLGYEYLATHLASNGYAVLSILGKEVNDRNGGDDVGMWARGELVLATLDALRSRADGMPADLLDRADLSRVGLMGHSRGGEGVVTAAHVNLARSEAERHALRGIVALAPTDFNELGVPGIALLALVPYCDGDVYSLHGLRTYDHSRLLDDQTPKVQLLVQGANHNYYNTQWYREVAGPLRIGDDAGMGFPTGAGSCGRERDLGGARLTPLETRAEAIVHVGGFLRWTVGNETGLAPYFTGALPLPEAACSSCEDVVVATAQLPALDRLVVVDATVPQELTLEGFGDTRVCAGSDCALNVYSAAPALDLRWSESGRLTLAFDAPRDWSAFDAFTFRAADPASESPAVPSYEVTISILDEAGASVDLDARELSRAFDRTQDAYVEAPPAAMGTSKVALQAVRVPLKDLSIDLARVASVTILFEGSGRALVNDFAVQAEPDVNV